MYEVLIYSFLYQINFFVVQFVFLFLLRYFLSQTLIKFAIFYICVGLKSHCLYFISSKNSTSTASTSTRLRRIIHNAKFLSFLIILSLLALVEKNQKQTPKIFFCNQGNYIYFFIYRSSSISRCIS